MMRENAQTKSRRYVVEGRVVLERVQPGAVVARVRGDATFHTVAWSPGRGWSCSCDARGRCSHQLAVGLVTAVDLEPPNDRRPNP